MTAVQPAPSERWSGRKWRLYVISIFAIQFLALFFLSDTRPPIVRYAPKRTGFYFVGEPERNGLLAENMMLNDQTLFALPNLHGFSGPAWLQPPRFEYRFTNWTEEPRWLQLSDANLDLTQPNHSSSNLSDDGFLPERPVAPLEKPILNGISEPPQSDYWVTGSLLRRPLLTPAAVPIQYYSEVLSNSVVQVGVDDDGNPISTRILRGSGWKPADDDALKITRQLRFRPTRGRDPANEPISSDLDWGVIVYQWFTLNPAQTNRPPVNP